MNICITQKYKEVLNELALLYNGKVYSHNKKNNAYRLTFSRKDNVLNLLDYYFSINPSKTIKQNRLMLIKKYYELRIMKCHLAPKDSSLHKA